MTIKRELHVYCDQCGAEGPHVVGERRPFLLRDLVKLGWKLTDQSQICMECVRPLSKLFPQEFTGEFAPQEDRSVHWTEARKKETSQ